MLIYDLGVYSKVIGNQYEISLLNDLLTVDDPPVKFINNGNMVLSGLIPFIESSLVNKVSLIINRSQKNIYSDCSFSPFSYPHSKHHGYQENTVIKMLQFGRGIVNVADGGGKIEIAMLFVNSVFSCFPKTKVLFISCNCKLRDQTYKRLREAQFADVTNLVRLTDIPSQITTATINTLLASKDNLMDYFKSVDIVIIDTCHLAAKDHYKDVILSIPTSHKYGLTGQIEQATGRYTARDYLVYGLIGCPIINIPFSQLIKEGYVSQPRVISQPIYYERIKHNNWLDVYKKGIVKNNVRNDLIVSNAKLFFEKKLKVLILVNQIGHGKHLLWDIDDFYPKARFLAGSGATYHVDPITTKIIKEQWDIHQFIKEMEGDDNSAIIIGSHALIELADIPSIDVIILAGGGKDYRRILQKAGSRMKPSERKAIYIIDYYDNCHYYLKCHSIFRMAFYEKEGYRFVNLIRRYGF
jgi:superfamily II DNA or RNA helicase